MKRTTGRGFFFRGANLRPPRMSCPSRKISSASWLAVDCQRRFEGHLHVGTPLIHTLLQISTKLRFPVHHNQPNSLYDYFHIYRELVVDSIAPAEIYCYSEQIFFTRPFTSQIKIIANMNTTEYVGYISNMCTVRLRLELSCNMVG